MIIYFYYIHTFEYPKSITSYIFLLLAFKIVESLQSILKELSLKTCENEEQDDCPPDNFSPDSLPRMIAPWKIEPHDNCHPDNCPPSPPQDNCLPDNCPAG